RAAQDPDDDLRRRAGRRFHFVGQSRQLSRAASALGDRRDRDPLAGRTDRDRHRSRRDALLSPRGDHRGRRGTRRRDDGKTRRAFRRACRRRARAGAPSAPATRCMISARRRWIGASAGLAALLVLVGAYAARALHTAEAPTRIDVAATPITSFDNRDPTRTRFGALEFRGGLALTSHFKAFGGISALHMEPDGARFIAVTD